MCSETDCWVLGSAIPDGSVNVPGTSVVSDSELVRSMMLMLCCLFLGMGVVDFLLMEGLFLLFGVEESEVLEAVRLAWFSGFNT